MQNWLIQQSVDLQKGPPMTVVWPHALMMVGDASAHTWRVFITYGGAAVDLAGAEVKGYFRRGDGVTIPVNGSTEGSVATVTLDAACYGIEGPLVGTMRVTTPAQKISVSKLIFRVINEISDSILDPGNIVSLEDLLAMVAVMEDLEQEIETAEAAREAAETDRAAAETAREAAESEREDDCFLAIQNAENATLDAEMAAAAIDGITVEADDLPEGSEPTAVVSEIEGVKHIAFGIPAGQTGQTGQRGQRTTLGTAISGTSTVPTAYPTGISDSIAGDVYQYDGTNDADIGNVYQCTLGGDAAAALWVYTHNIRGPAGAGDVSSVDGIMPISGNVPLNALRAYTAADANTITANGIHVLVSSASHVPSAANNWVIQHMNYDGNHARQIAHVVGAAMTMYFRAKTAGVWGAWSRLLASEIQVTDSGGYFAGTQAEAVLQEIGAALKPVPVSMTAIGDFILGSTAQAYRIGKMLVIDVDFTCPAIATGQWWDVAQIGLSPQSVIRTLFVDQSGTTFNRGRYSLTGAVGAFMAPASSGLTYYGQMIVTLV